MPVEEGVRPRSWRTNQQIAWRTTIGVRLSLFREPDHHSVIHTGRNLHA